MPEDSNFPTHPRDPQHAGHAIPDPVVIRPAELNEADMLSTIAYQAKAYWGYPQVWLMQWQAELTIRPEFISWHWIHVAEIDQQVVGFYALAPRSDHASLEHLWLLPEFIGIGLGKKLFEHAVKLAAAQGFGFIQIVADPNAVGFYQHMGAVKSHEIRYQLFDTERVLPVLRLVIHSGTE